MESKKSCHTPYEVVAGRTLSKKGRILENIHLKKAVYVIIGCVTTLTNGRNLNTELRLFPTIIVRNVRMVGTTQIPLFLIRKLF